LEGLEVSILNLSDLERTLRIDSEFYSKENLVSQDILESINSQPIKEYVTVSDGNHASISEYFVNEGIPYYRGGDIYNFFIEQTQNPLRIPKEVYDWNNMKRSHLKKGDVLVSTIGAIIGNLSLVRTNQEATCSCKLAILRPKSIDAELVAIFLKSKYGQSQIQKFRRGTGQTGFILEDFDQIKIPTFSKEFSFKIKTLVNEAFEKFEKSQSLYSDAEKVLLFEVGFLGDESAGFTDYYDPVWVSDDPIEQMIANNQPGPKDELEFYEEEWAAIFDEQNRLKAIIDYDGQIAHWHKNEPRLRFLATAIEEKRIQLKFIENNRNNLEYSSAHSKKTNIKTLKESFGTTGRLDAEYYQPKYEFIVQKLMERPHDRLCNVVSITKSIEPGSAHYAEEGGLPFYRVSDYTKFGLSQPDKNLTDAFVADNIVQIKNLKPKKGTILFSKDGSVGTAYLLRNDLDGITSGAILHLHIKNPETLLPEYLALALNSRFVQMQAERDAGGSIILHWRKEEIEQVVVPILTKSRQEQIAKLVEESFGLKVESERLLEVAKRAVEIAIEQSEAVAMVFLANEIGVI
jgi:restriction endonuclease S subunit